MKSNIELQNLEIGLRREIAALDGVSVNPNDFTTRTPPDAGEELSQMSANYLDNSDLDFSTDAYSNNPTVGGDTAEQCFNFYRHRFIRITDAVLVNGATSLTSVSAPFKSGYTYPMDFFALRAGTSEKALVGTLTRTNNTTAVLSAASQADITDGIVFFGDDWRSNAARAVKSSAHSLYAANEGANTSIVRWDKTAGQAELGGDGTDNYTIAVPLPINLATRGLEMFFAVNVKLRSGAACDTPIRLFTGIYDTTGGNTKFLEADNFDLDVTFVGTAGTTDYECVVVGTFAGGEQVMSDVVTVTNCAAILNATDFLDWNWDTAPRVLDFALYRKTVGTTDVVRVFTIYNGETRFFDQYTDGEEAVADLPTAPARREYAYAESLSFTPTTEYRRVPIFFRVPATYDQAATTSNQILLVGAYNDAANDVRPLVIDRPILSLKESVWNRSQRDIERSAATVPTSGTPDGNQNGCFTANNPIIIKRRPEHAPESIPISEAEKGMFIFNGAGWDRITEVKKSTATRTFYVKLSGGIEFECTASERFITSASDTKGTRFDRLTLGDVIQTSIGGITYQSRIKSTKITETSHPQIIYTLSLQRDKIFLVGFYRPNILRRILNFVLGIKPCAGAKAHNLKPGDYIVE